AAQMSYRRPSRGSFLLSLYYIGPGIGILLSGIVTPFLLEVRGPGSWWLAWALLAALAGFLAVPFGFVAIEGAAGGGPQVAARFRLSPMLPLLVGYLLFGAGYIGYMTFMVAWVRDTGGGAPVQSAFWSLIGIGGLMAPWIWWRLIATTTGGRAIAVLSAITLVGAVLPFWWASTAGILISALVFLCAFFSVTPPTAPFFP